MPHSVSWLDNRTGDGQIVVGLSEKAELVKCQAISFEVDPETVDRLAEIIRNTGTIIGREQVGVFEFESFYLGTQATAHTVAG